MLNSFRALPAPLTAPLFTGLMHWFTGPYVHRLTYDRSTQRFSAKTMSLLARPVQTTFFPNEVKYPQSLRPNVTFQVRQSAFLWRFEQHKWRHPDC